MRAWSLILVALLAAGVLAGCATKFQPDADGDGFVDSDEVAAGSDPENAASVPQPPAVSTAADDAVVVAVLDFQVNPYHYDFLGSQMPQHLDADPSNDLPVERAPHEWLPGFPDPSAFASYSALSLTLATDEGADPQALFQKDQAAWETLEESTETGVHFRYVPGTKAIGVISFGGTDVFAPTSHGLGTSSVSVGNLHGSCPTCLFVFVNAPTEAGFRWVTQQPWIDAMTNSYGAGSFQVAGLVRDNIYDDCDLDAQKAGVERGQQIFFSGGNGFANAFDAPPQTLWSCQKGPDWIVTVGATTPDGESSYTGHGKPVDVAAPGSGYPSAGAASVTDESTFSGTSNAAPVTAGLYASALHALRERLPGASRVQEGGVIATGPAGCGAEVPDCALADGALTVHELREALYRAATPSSGFFEAPGGVAVPVGNAETELWTEGHGSFRGTLGDRAAEVARIVAFAAGETTEVVGEDLVQWMLAYSYCAQQVWGVWDHGAWTSAATLPAPDPQWPYRTFMATECPTVISALVTVATTVGPT